MNRTLLRGLIGLTAFLSLQPVVLFASAGTLEWPTAWLYCANLLVATVVSRWVAWKRNPDLLMERARFGQGPGAKDWDRFLMLFVGLVGPLFISIVAGLDRRYGWSPPLPSVVVGIAILVLLLGTWLAVWAMIANRFFSATVRIQADRGHHVVTDGPYRIVRHPSYIGGILSYLAFPFMVGAMWSLLPALTVCAALVVRTALEDSALQAELAGYQEYAQKTRYRLLPRIW